jgi:hypothetical protein
MAELDAELARQTLARDAAETAAMMPPMSLRLMQWIAWNYSKTRERTEPVPLPRPGDEPPEFLAWLQSRQVPGV